MWYSRCSSTWSTGGWWTTLLWWSPLTMAEGPGTPTHPWEGLRCAKFVCYNKINAVCVHVVCYIVVWWPWEWYSNVPLREEKVYDQYFLVLWKCSLFYTGSKLPIFRKPFTREVSEGLLSFTPPFLDVVGPTGVSFIALYHLCFTSSVFPGTLLYLIIPFWIWDRPLIFTHNPNPGDWCIMSHIS